MASLKTKFNVGLFLLLGLILACVAIIWLGMSHYFEEGKNYVSYFDESVQGLDKDSSVKYRGVAIGRVEKISVAPDGNLIEVVMKVNPNLKIEEEILVAQLKSIGITGIMFIELDQMGKEEIEHSPKIKFEAKYPVIPTKPSDMKKIMQGLDNVYNHIISLDFEGISNKMKATLDTINNAVIDFHFKDISNDFRNVLSNANNVMTPKKWNNLIDSIGKTSDSYRLLANNASNTLSNADETIKRVEGIVSDNKKTLSEVFLELNNSMKNANLMITNLTKVINNTDSKLFNIERHVLVTLQNIESATEHLNRLIEITSEQPSQLLFGEPPKQRDIKVK
ncbi:MAG: MCE family protein [Desulfobacterales bacterium]|nr:MCE family protein [Desulfobacterales bacterium]MBF0396273.1 MCE family protein [Desulfobacterales bacterium]